ncbi:5-methyltetrahydropteroyltriglutamate--homocysteine S-methyltransferase [Sphingobacterium bambusae]|uniref:5-methyltetrahydropteroyltriglutamate--homocysteine S-methyltransferase n=1 Tax=Sphingobacterium bambusae TaxID=662858 RepID=A0ABW6BHA6_9SPHI|nr:5-methyltetrahydropteroyltriglutamate--homocysteine S-methyltransferase [Sphingobacterium bambusae]WPL49517.1 5-methyltetrahydropteroyltriglutamate--homocysteine S-methyltransferase [Sphingobacterium bambusae]
MKQQESAPFIVDIVGSFLRPARIKEARKERAAGLLSASALRDIENEEIIRLVAQQKTAGIKGITDGEFRRAYWHLDFMEGIEGIEGYVPEQGYNQTFKGAALPAYDVRIVGPLWFPADHPFIADFTFLKDAVGSEGEFIAKATIPSPSMVIRQELLAKLGSSRIDQIYPNREVFYDDLVQTYQDAIQAFYAAGCRYIQFDDTNWAFLIDAEKRKSLVEKGMNPDEIAQLCTDIINRVLVAKPADMVITTHICRGNHASAWIFSGGYEPIAEQLFATNYDGYFMEYDSDRSGGFEPLAKWRPGSGKVVLGLVTSKFPELEDKDAIKAKIAEAAAYVPLASLCLSPQCGFSSTETGNKLGEEDQWKKMALIREIAEEVWAV